jgi:NADPH-dependent 2,4-dienoyl-CoA reductase/sulfur reductase-like enzyme
MPLAAFDEHVGCYVELGKARNSVQRKMILIFILTLVIANEYCDRFKDEQSGAEHLSARVAVVGGGIAGTSFAYYARRSMPNLQITLFEADSLIGGRIRNTTIVDEGASRCDVDCLFQVLMRVEWFLGFL